MATTSAWRTLFTTWPPLNEWRLKIPSMHGSWLSCSPKLISSLSPSLPPWDLSRSQTSPTRFRQHGTAWVTAPVTLFSSRALDKGLSPGTALRGALLFLTFLILPCHLLALDSSVALSCHQCKVWTATTSTWLAILTLMHSPCLLVSILLCYSLHLGLPTHYPKRVPVP